jgi:dihydrofolate reductase
MRNLIYAINISLDGCCDHTKMSVDEGMLEHYTNLIREVGLFVYGRKTYQLMVPYWPDVAKDPSETKDRSTLRKHLSPKTKLFSHEPWRALKIKIRELFVRTFATKYLN